MQTVPAESEFPRNDQFKLWSVFEFVTVCAVLSALSAVIGVAASGCLMLMALFLWARQGFIALAMFMAASLLADWSHDKMADTGSLTRQLAVISVASALCLWYRLRRSRRIT